MRHHRFAVQWRFWPRALSVTLISAGNSYAALLQRLLYRRKIDQEPLPRLVFIVGHWRCGTSYLHELLATDPRFLSPTVLECFCPKHFIRLPRFLSRLGFLLPKQRPMDDMAFGWNRPQEDEFALLAMGSGSPYEIIGFPNDLTEASARLRPAAFDRDRAKTWLRDLAGFYRAVSFYRRKIAGEGRGRRLEPEFMLLKSPTHTARIALLRELFPTAKFIHLSRTPYELVPSSIKLWRALFETQAFRRVEQDTEGLFRFVSQLGYQLYREFDRDVSSIPAGSIVHVRYEDLVAQPLQTVERILTSLGIEVSPSGRRGVVEYLNQHRDHKKNHHVLSADMARRIADTWFWYFERFGYLK